MTTATTPANQQAEFIHRAQWKAGVIGGLNVAALVLSVRLILMIAVLGAIGLAWMALSTHDLVRLVALALYSLTVVLPLVWLAGRGR
jgi:hypothetical protein